MSFLDKLRRVTRPTGLGLCVGLDPDPNKMPAGYSSDLGGISAFLQEVITVSTPFASAYKVNTAFYEAWGSKGWKLLEKIADYLPDVSVRIADAKRGDIGNTAIRYAHAFFEHLPFDAITLNPYLGGDTLQPFLEDPEKGAYVLALTTNPGSRDLQHFHDGKRELYQLVLKKIPEWAPQGNLGAVVGATHPQELTKVRRDYPSIPLLIPGIGAQGGDIEAVRGLAIGDDVGPVLVNISRAILYPKSNLKFPDSVAEACGQFHRMLLKSHKF